jgi:hypothetical protein
MLHPPTAGPCINLTQPFPWRVWSAVQRRQSEPGISHGYPFMPYPSTAGPRRGINLTQPFPWPVCSAREISSYPPKFEPALLSMGGRHANKSATAADLLAPFIPPLRSKAELTRASKSLCCVRRQRCFPSRELTASLFVCCGPGITPQPLLLLLRGKDETRDIEDLGSVLRNSSIQTLCLPTISLFSPMVTTQVRQQDFCAEALQPLQGLGKKLRTSWLLNTVNVFDVFCGSDDNQMSYRDEQRLWMMVATVTLCNV